MKETPHSTNILPIFQILTAVMSVSLLSKPLQEILLARQTALATALALHNGEFHVF